MKQQHLHERERVNLGSYYTPEKCVGIVRDILAPHLDGETVLLDSACGYGSFLKNDAVREVVGVDIDGYAALMARRLRPDATILHRNALIDVSRESFGIPETRRLAVVGNPPYNDRTSQIRRHIKRKPDGMDRDLRKRDLGLSFLMSYAKLRADVICVLHPLSYLIKMANFRLLRGFKEFYDLREGVLIGSGMFEENSAATQFPIVIALYVRSSQGMSYGKIARFPFRTMDGRTLRLSDHDFIPKYIDKYPKKNVAVTDESLFFYPLRDINALKRNRTFVRDYRPNLIVIDKCKLDYYIYIDVFKRNLGRLPWYYGNCDVFIDDTLFRKYRGAFVANAVEHHPFLETHVAPPASMSSGVDEYFRTLNPGTASRDVRRACPARSHAPSLRCGA